MVFTLDMVILHSKALVVSRKRKDTTMIEVPTDRQKRVKFFLEEARKLLEGDHDEVNRNHFNVPPAFQNILNYGAGYQWFGGNINDVVSNTSLITMNSRNLQYNVTRVANVVLDSIIMFEGAHFYITSVDVFVHNHHGIDGCAYGIDLKVFNMTLCATIEKKTHLHSSSFFELSVFWGFFELLVTGGFFIHGNGQPEPFLGSSIANWSLGSLKSTDIIILKKQE